MPDDILLNISPEKVSFKAKQEVYKGENIYVTKSMPIELSV